MFVSIIVGVICIVLGVLNMKGNISSIHSYHRNRVSEEDRLPFGRLVGIGTIIIGVSLMAFGGLTFVSELLKSEVYIWIGLGTMFAGLAAGIGLSFYAMIKYNRGIF